MAYLRVSKVDQDLEKNKSDILFLANEKSLGKVHFTEEKISGTVSWKDRKLSDVLSSLKKGDNLIVSELSRLGRSMLECMEILSIASQKGVNVYAVKGKWALENNIQSKIIAMAFTMASEIERDLISQRTKEALRARKEAGVKLGRPKGPGKSKLDQYRPEIEALLANGSTQKYIAERYNTTEANLFHWIKKNKIKRYWEKELSKKNDEVKIATIDLWLRVENNSSHVRGRKKAITAIQLLLTSDYEGKCLDKDGVEYLLKVRYKTVEGLEKEINDLAGELESIADSVNCFTENHFYCKELGRGF